ncbi:hypothetical protein [Fructobacillus parabroussonetiae]|uniref:Uncharacterized protein n=1 Tax=Fructobacillus parabroussonetiae TaxID=2713174 RepID=A0ABS5QWH1_9LACO|nr:hypothetical protein [Fructobacillus parabroussonetiae]MBS9337142.1 hypothetical protein [Fructobacillus parabroussonetiae]
MFPSAMFTSLIVLTILMLISRKELNQIKYQMLLYVLYLLFSIYLLWSDVQRYHGINQSFYQNLSNLYVGIVLLATALLSFWREKRGIKRKKPSEYRPVVRAVVITLLVIWFAILMPAIDIFNISLYDNWYTFLIFLLIACLVGYLIDVLGRFLDRKYPKE